MTASPQRDGFLAHAARIWRHRWIDERLAYLTLPPEAARRLSERVAASEARHTGEIRFCVEASLPLSYLWRAWRQGLPLAAVIRERALMQFAKLRVWDTEDNNGVLIYLLLAERAIEIVADRGLARQVAPEAWQGMVERLGQALRGGQVEEGLTQALEEVSALLVERFPQADTPGAPPNQLPDEPVLL